MISIKTEIVPDTYTGRGCNIRASCVVKGVEYEAFSRSCPVQALCRVLVEAGVKDQSAEVKSDALPGFVSVRHRSIHAEAGYTYGESQQMSLRRAKYIDPATRTGAV
jgi:hypothetical protein